jgi:hypothetical protein
MSPIENTPPGAPLPRNTTPLPVNAPAPKPAKPQTDAFHISIDARARLGKDQKPEVVVENMVVDGGDVQEQIDVRAKGKSAGVQRQIAEKVVAAIAEQVAHQIEPVLEEKLASALEAEHLSPQLAHEVALKCMPQIAQVIAQQLAQKVKVSYSLGH